MTKNVFPKDFIWGASTASHQVEGGTENQWSVWELANAKELAETAERRLGWLPKWDEIKTDAQKPSNYVSGRGIEHYTRYKEDFSLAKKLELNGFRFGVEWSRLQPKEGEWDENAIAHYHDYIDELNKRGLEPFLNLWHWTMPTWFSDKGGFEKGSNLKYWRRFVEKIIDEYGGKVNYIITLNEPNVYTTFGYATGIWPPDKKNDYLGAARVLWHMVRAHRQAYRIIKKKHPQIMVGIAQQLANIQAKRAHNFFDELSTKMMRYVWNWWFYRRIRNQQDFIGFNYYFTDYYTGMMKRENPKLPINDLGWYMEPEGLYPLLLRTWARYKKPIFVTENGVADKDDAYRRWWIEETMVAMERAISEGVDLRGYFHWSLLDNFEWAYGWWPRFGLIEVDRKHDMKRTIRPSALWYRDRIKEIRTNSK